MTTSTMASVMRGFHVYNDIHELSQDILPCIKESGNINDPYAVAMMNGNAVVGQVTRVISALCSKFLRKEVCLNVGSQDINAIQGIFYREV
uniref:Uncharacterized protein n=1 Tax=Amphimedon queenslandica TaxID=400682 RepID=A0A1X7VBQ8_AMPQE